MWGRQLDCFYICGPISVDNEALAQLAIVREVRNPDNWKPSSKQADQITEIERLKRLMLLQDLLAFRYALRRIGNERLLTFEPNWKFSERDPDYSLSRHHTNDGDTSYRSGPALCAVCSSIDFQGLSTNGVPKERYEVRYGRPGGFESFSSTCPLCKLLCEKVLGVSPGDASSIVVMFDFVPIFSPSIQGTKSRVLDGLWFRSGGKFGHLVFSASSDNPASVEIKRRPPTATYNCQEAYDLVRRWLGDCSIHHALCPRDINVPLPTRVIDIGDATHPPMLYIPPAGTRGRYIALSYCWGNSQAVTLTEERLKRLPVLFPLRTLPRTLRDAVIIASHLGFRYLWVDALCIIQDSFEGLDWKQESPNMNKIYGNAVLTIAAAAATATTEGIFSFGTGLKKPTCSLPYRLADGQFGMINIEVYETEESPEESLDCRAWALQEALISPRLLRYGSKQMSWKCNQIEENANGPLINWSKQPTSKTGNWMAIVTDYTARTLTYNSDRLAALAGYAKLLGIKRPYDEYLAGLWKSELLGQTGQLLWYRSAKSDPSPRPLSRYSPSWSWASIDSAVRFTHWPLNYHSHAEIINVSTYYSQRGPLSPLEGPQQSILSIQGYVKSLDYGSFFQESGGIAKFHSTHKFQSTRRNGPDQPSGEVILDISGPFDAFANGNTPSLVCVHFTPTCGLILVATSNQNEIGLYERIGLATGSIFEEWFTDASCGSYGDEIVRIL